MTCIVGIQSHNRVILGGDRCQTNGYLKQSLCPRPKVARLNDDIIIGESGTAGVLDAIRDITFPPRGDVGPADYIRREMVPLMRRVTETPNVNSWLVGIGSELYVVYHSWYVEAKAEYAIGSGAEVAHGVLYVTKKDHPASRICLALHTASTIIDSVSPPFDYLDTLGTYEQDKTKTLNNRNT